MAKNDKKTNATEDKKKAPRETLDGWDNVTSERNAPWLVKRENFVLEGELLGRFSFQWKGKEKPYYQIRVGKGSDEINGSTKEGEEVVPIGAVVSVDEIATLRDLRPLTEDGGRYRVRLAFKDKDTSGEFPLWKVDVKKQTLSPPTRVAPRPAPLPARDREDESDVPF